MSYMSFVSILKTAHLVVFWFFKKRIKNPDFVTLQLQLSLGIIYFRLWCKSLTVIQDAAMI